MLGLFSLIRKILLSALFWVFLGCVPLDQASNNLTTPPSQKKLRLDNFQYEENIKTVRLYPLTANYDEVIQPAIIPLGSAGLILEFDQLFGDYQNYYARIIHCNSDWTKSRLNDIEFLPQYNEFQISDYQYSFGTRTSYVHYRWLVPPVKVSGNYVVKVYREGNEADLILTRRFMVYDNQVQFDATVDMSRGILERQFNQQVQFAINYPKLASNNPLEDIKVIIRQNKRWDNALVELKPTSIKSDISRLEYRYFNLENEFPGGNEFRFFDLRSVNTLGQNIASIDRHENRIDVFILKDLPNRKQGYGLVQDINGEFVVGNLESDPPAVTSDYAFVSFFLESEPLADPVYVFGALSDWQYGGQNIMNYNSELGGYQATLLLKQGWYNYMYYVPDNSDPYRFEGSYFETENLYEILVYYRALGTFHDQLVGYANIIHNRRN